MAGRKERFDASGRLESRERLSGLAPGTELDKPARCRLIYPVMTSGTCSSNRSAVGQPGATDSQRSAAYAVAVVLLGIQLGCTDSTPAARVTVSPQSFVLSPGECRDVRLSWHMLRALDRKRGRLIVFAHILDRPHHVITTFDHPFPSEWRPGTREDYVVQTCQPGAPPLKPGKYMLSLGLYEDDWGYRWPLQTGGREVALREYEVGKIAIRDR